MANLNVVNPFTSEVIAILKIQPKEEAFKILDNAFDLHKRSPNGLPKEKRIQILEKFYDHLKLHQEELIQKSISEGGKPLQDTILEMNRALEGVKLGIQSVRNICGEIIPMDLNEASSNKLAFTSKSPIGVVLSISAFNHPINLAIHQIVPCIAAGCPVIYKPALTTPLVSSRIIELLLEAGLPKEWCSYLLCDNEVIRLLAKSNLLGYISFIGSPEIGWNMKKNIAPGVKITLEHGGNAPIIISKNANISKAAPQVAKAGFYHAGQVCVSAQRVYVHEENIASFTSQLNLQAQLQKVGNPKNKTTLIGPIITEEAINRIDKWVMEAINEGATLICGGNKLKNNCYEPTILLNPSKKSAVTKAEIFGPIICIYSFQTNEEAINEANSSPYIFQSAAYSQNLNESFEFSKNLNGSAVIINSHPAFRVDWMPFGGQGLSGEGLGGIDYSVQEMLKQKLIVIQQD